MTPSAERPGTGGWLHAVAPAKVNPWLHVGERRADGYREVDLGLLALEFADELRARHSPDGESSLSIEGPAASADIPSDGRNLVLRAAEAVAREAGLPSALEFRLTKRIPSRAGLGGGSADAAAAALLARELLGAPLDIPGLARLLARLGSDCPFFVTAGGTGWGRGRGRGERVEALAAPQAPLWFALVVPDLECPTAAVYKALRGGRGSAQEGAPAAPPAELLALGEASLAGTRAALGNDLEPAALACVPGLAAWRAVLDRAGGSHFRLSGSGSAFFGIYAAEQAARAGLQAVEDALAAAQFSPRLLQVTRTSGCGARLAPPPS